MWRGRPRSGGGHRLHGVREHWRSRPDRSCAGIGDRHRTYWPASPRPRFWRSWFLLAIAVIGEKRLTCVGGEIYRTWRNAQTTRTPPVKARKRFPVFRITIAVT